MTENSIQVDPRRHDLDALRAFAMLLGIVLHGAMSFIPGAGAFWGVQDLQASPFYGVLLASIHGWRMPLFFLVSGFFTAMLCQKRGLRALLLHRFKRIFLPLLLSMVTIVPTMLVVSGFLRSQGSVAPSATSLVEPEGIRSKSDQVKSAVVDVWAAVAKDDQTTLKAYLDQGGDVSSKDPYGSTPMHLACLFGRTEAAELLLEAGTDLNVLNNDGKRPEELLQLDWGTTAFIAQMVQVPLDREELLVGREAIARSISEKTGRLVAATPEDRSNSAAGNILYTVLFQIPVFFHLWFLWFLCWYVIGFVLIVKSLRSLKTPAIPGEWLISGLRYLWLIPLAAAAQYFMASGPYAYGPDTSFGLLPLPAVFGYYAIFFGYGALYFGAGDTLGAIGKGFGWKLALAILILFPAGLGLQGPDSVGGRILFAILQSSYTWVMSFGMIGLFHRFCRTHRFWVRYLSDSSYWLYIVHIPLLTVFQFLVRDWPLPSVVKFVLVLVVTTTSLLVSYQLFVRNTWIGRLLNGRRYPGRNNAPLAQTLVVENTASG